MSASEGKPGPAADRVARWVRAPIRASASYGVAEAGEAIKLDAMENPYPWPGELQQAWLESLAGVELNRYPDAHARELAAALRRWMQVPEALDLLVGNGSDELIQIVLTAVAGPGRCVLAPVPTFVMYEVIARALGLQFVGVPLDADFGLDAPAMLAAIRAHQPAAVFLARPNNPTGNLFDAGAVQAVIDASPGVVVIDEAYHPFCGDSLMDRAVSHDHVLVLRTLSKIGLAGLRLGALAGAPAWLAEFDKVRLPYNVGTLAQASAVFALRHAGHLQAQIARIVDERARLAGALAALPGVQAFPSAANFILVRLRHADPAAVHAAMLERGVLVKDLHRAGGALAGCLRLTVGAPPENDAMLAALAAAL